MFDLESKELGLVVFDSEQSQEIARAYGDVVDQGCDGCGSEIESTELGAILPTDDGWWVSCADPTCLTDYIIEELE